MNTFEVFDSTHDGKTITECHDFMASSLQPLRYPHLIVSHRCSLDYYDGGCGGMFGLYHDQEKPQEYTKILRETLYMLLLLTLVSGPCSDFH